MAPNPTQHQAQQQTQSFRDTLFDRFRLDGLTALVTGAGPGLGFAVARAFAAAGAAVALCARSQDKVDRAVRTIEDDGGTALGVVADVARAEDLERFVGLARDQLGPIQILFNNAASHAGQNLDGLMTDPLSLTAEQWQSQFDVNILAPYRLAQLVVPEMKARGYGSIVNVTAVAGYRPKPHIGSIAYAATKAGLTMMTRQLAKECGPEVRANMICPGSLHPTGEMREIWAPSMAGVPLGRVGRSDEAVGAALLLASPASSYTTGTTIFVDGGRVSAAA
jgi:NAD(P)-dependent dehydrogenase (short-subunit alcohol dehydrogenase family)